MNINWYYMTVTWGFPLVMTAMVGYGTSLIKKMVKENQSIKNSQKELLKCQIVRAHERCVDDGWISFYTLESLETVYKEYKILGGNSFATKLMDELRALDKHSAITIQKKGGC